MWWLKRTTMIREISVVIQQIASEERNVISNYQWSQAYQKKRT